MKDNIAVKVYRILRTVQAEGIIAGLKFAIVQFLRSDVLIRFRGFQHPVLIRSNTSDAAVSFDTFVKKGYKTPDNNFLKVIIDLGANVGYSAVYFANHYPSAKIVCLEPSEENFKLLEINTRYYKNVVLVNKAVWWRKAHLAVENPNSGSWGFRFKEVQYGGTSSIAIDDLLRDYSCGGNVMVKMDIEGAENEIFAECSDWIRETSYIQIEIHGCWKVVFDRLASFNYAGEISGENVVIEILREPVAGGDAVR